MSRAVYVWSVGTELKVEKSSAHDGRDGSVYILESDAAAELFWVLLAE
jgi:hypothetical protein